MSYLFMDPGKFEGTWFNNFQQNVFTQFTCQNVSTFTDNRKFRRILPAFLIAIFFLFSIFCSLTLVYRKNDVFVVVVFWSDFLSFDCWGIVNITHYFSAVKKVYLASEWNTKRLFILLSMYLYSVKQCLKYWLNKYG